MLGPETTPGATPANMEERMRQLEARLRDLQERYERRPQAMFERIESRPRALLERMVPSDVRAHLRASQREQLLALRAWLDVAIKRTEPSERPRRPESVRIE
jgi:hypothetical protein